MKIVKLVHSKMSFTTRDEIYKQFQEEDNTDVLLRTICLLETGIILTHARQIIIMDLNYNIFLSDQIKKRIFGLAELMN